MDVEAEVRWRQLHLQADVRDRLKGSGPGDIEKKEKPDCDGRQRAKRERRQPGHRRGERRHPMERQRMREGDQRGCGDEHEARHGLNSSCGPA